MILQLASALGRLSDMKLSQGYDHLVSNELISSQEPMIGASRQGSVLAATKLAL